MLYWGAVLRVEAELKRLPERTISQMLFAIGVRQGPCENVIVAVDQRFACRNRSAENLFRHARPRAR